MQINEILMAYGIHLSAAAVWDMISQTIKVKKPKTKSELVNLVTEELKNLVHIENAELVSCKLIELLAVEGAIIQNGNLLYSDDSIIQKTEEGGIILTKNTTTKTPNTAMYVQGQGASLTQKGNTDIVQNTDSIRITVRGKK